MIRIATLRKNCLLASSAGMALAYGLALAPHQAMAQAFNASPTVVQGVASVQSPTPTSSTIEVGTIDTVIDWLPFEDSNGDAFTFLPAGNVATFQNLSPSNQFELPQNANFAVLNRILPATNGNVAVFNGTVISQLQTASGNIPGGFVAFYSPTGILVGSSAVFDIGGLLLTTLEPDLGSFTSFVTGGGSLSAGAPAGSSAPVTIQPGAQITGAGEGSFFVAMAPQVTMGGTANVNGSVAYIAAEQVNIAYANGLFDIVIPVGTTVGAGAITHTGTTTGPTSNGTGDDHIIYAVTRANTNPVSMLIGGNLGFQPAAVAGVENGQVILAANYNVNGRMVAGSSVDESVFDAGFTGLTPASFPAASIIVEDVSVSSDLAAIATDAVRAGSVSQNTSFAGDLILVARDAATLSSAVGFTTSVTGDVLVSARGFGLLAPNLPPAVYDALGGIAQIASNGGNISINGNVLVTASAFSGVNTATGQAGSATGGQALIQANGGNISITGESVITSRAGTIPTVPLVGSGAIQGGEAYVAALAEGTVSFNGNVSVFASATSPNVTSDSTAGAAAATGGNARLDASSGGTVTANGAVSLGAQASGGSSAANVGSGGRAEGGSASVNAVAGGAIAINGDLTGDVSAAGGSGNNGGDAFGGQGAGLFTSEGSVEVSGIGTFSADAVGGDASVGFGGAGGNAEGGTVFIQAGGTNAAADVTIGNVTLSADGSGGTGGAGDGIEIAAGAGGRGAGGLFNAESMSGGAFILTEGKHATLITGDVAITADGTGGAGGAGGTGEVGGAGGLGQGGTVQIGAIDAANNAPTLPPSSASLGSIIGSADALGGSGGTGGAGSGTGGAANAGLALLTVDIGALTAGTTELSADAFGGIGSIGGSGTGGFSGIDLELGGTITLASFDASSEGSGGSGLSGAGGVGTGGEASVTVHSGALTVTGGLNLSGGAFGGLGSTGQQAAATGGAAFFATQAGTTTLSSATIESDVEGGDGSVAGESLFFVDGTAIVDVTTLALSASAFAEGASGGIAGGDIELEVTGGEANIASLFANARALGGSQAQGGSISIFAGGGLAGETAELTVAQATLDAGVSGPGTNIVGDFDIAVENGGIAQFTTIVALANGGTSPAEESSGLDAESGGRILILDSGTFNSAGAIRIETSENGLIVGGTSPEDLSANLSFTSGGTITLEGDNDDLTSFGAESLTMTSKDLEILPGARFGAVELTFASTNTSAPAVIGGTEEGAGYTVTASEAERIEAGSIRFLGARVTSEESDGPDVIVRDLVALGSLDEGPGTISITTPGVLQIAGRIEYTSASAEDTLNLIGGERVEIITPSGGVFVNDGNGNLSGQLNISSQTIVAAVADLAAQIAADPEFAGLAEALKSNNGTLDADGYIRARGVALLAGQNIYVQNTGTQSNPGGVLVGDGGLLVGQITTTSTPDTGGGATTGFSFTGTLTTINDVLQFEFTVDSSAQVTLRTYSYAGGTNAQGEQIPSGGFDPILSLFDAAGVLIDRNDDGGSGNVPADPTTGNFYDTFLQANLEPGEYTVVITAFPNFPLGTTLAEGFRSDASGSGRTLNFAFDILGAGSAEGPGQQVSGPINVIAFGRRQTTSGQTVGGAQFFGEVDFGGNLSERFTAASTFNGCVIVGGSCGAGPVSPVPIDSAPPINNPAVLVQPTQGTTPIQPAEEESEDAFGVDFPGLIDSTLMLENTLIDDPVTSGGDSALYSTGQDDDDDDDDDDDGDGDGDGDENEDDSDGE